MGLQKTIAFVVLILLGVLLKKKISSKEQVSGIKVIILSVALPATIFIALLKIEISASLLLLPFLALLTNFLMFGGAKIFTKIFVDEKMSAKKRTLLLLMPSFAPGLSCFPFLTEYLGSESLALGALADVGNKVFGLIILYLIAMSWHYKLIKSQAVRKAASKYKDLLLSLIKEPINVVIVIAISMLCVGLGFADLPVFGQDAISKMSLLMTPLVLIFIGIAVKVQKKDVLKIMQVLFWRAGMAFIISAVFLMILPSKLSPLTLLVVVVLPQSSCSFWPFAHMAAVSKLDEQRGVSTFDLDLAINILAFSLPFSTSIILLILSSGSFFASTSVLLVTASILLFLALLPKIYQIARKQDWSISNTDFVKD